MTTASGVGIVTKAAAIGAAIYLGRQLATRKKKKDQNHGN